MLKKPPKLLNSFIINDIMTAELTLGLSVAVNNERAFAKTKKAYMPSSYFHLQISNATNKRVTKSFEF